MPSPSTLGALLALNFSVIPIRPKDKIAAIPWKSYQTEHSTHQELEEWFANGHDYNPGIVTGAISGIVVVDTDTAEGEQWAAEHLPDTPLKVRTARGIHRYYRHPGGTIRNKARIRAGVDVRADGGYVVGPGSVHASGVVYEPIGELPKTLDLVPVFDTTWIPTKTHQVITGNNLYSSRSRNDTTSPARLLQRARAYVDKVPPAIAGQGGNTHTFILACRLVRGFDLSDGEALDVLSSWNQTCVPPWSERELEQLIQNAHDHGDEPVGGRLDVRDVVHEHDDVDVHHRADVNAPKEKSAVADETSYPFTDAGNAEYFAALHGDRLRFDHQLSKWLEWESPIWRPDADASVRRLAKDAMRARYHDAGKIEDADALKKAANWAIQSENRTRLEALLYLAQAEPPIADPGQTWDTDPYLLACPNGVVDLKTGRLRPGRQSDRLTMRAGVAYDPSATCPRWASFLEEVMGGRSNLVDYLQRVVGYMLTGDVSEQCWWLWYGSGANGKGTMIRALANALGDYETCTPFSTFLYQANNTLTNDLARLRGRRFVWAQEASQQSRLNEERIKSLTGGDTVIARFLHREFFEFQPTLKLVLAVNHKPVVRDDSFGMWRRVRVVPFTQRFDIDKTLDTVLAAEASGILTWAVRGALLWQAEGLATPTSVTSATADYEAESDPLREFIESCCLVDPDAKIPSGELYSTYIEWADREDLTTRERLTRNRFARMIGERFERDRGTGGRRFYLGIGKLVTH